MPDRHSSGTPPWLEPWLEVAPVLAIAITTVVLAWAYAPMFRGELAGDDNTFHFAEVARIGEALRAGDLDLWSPAANLGFATGYYYQLVPAFIPGVFTAVFGHPLFWFQLFAFLSLILVPVAAYRGLRVMGASPWAAVAAAIAIAFTSSHSKWGGGPNSIFWVGLYTQAWALCGFPLAFGHGARWLAEGRGLAGAVGWGTFVGLCHPIAGVALGAALALAVVPMVLVGARRRSPPARLIVLGALMLVAAAPAWVPVIVDYEGFGGFPARVKGEEGPGWGLLGRWLIDGHMFDERRGPVVSLALVAAVPFAAVVLRRRPYLAWLAIASLGFGVVLGVGPSLRTEDDLFPAVRVLGPLQVTAAALVGAALVEGALWALAATERRWFATAVQLAAGVVLGLALIAVVAPVLGSFRARVKVATDFPAIHRRELDELLPVIRAAPPGRIQVRGVENHWFMVLPYVHADRPALAAFGGAALQSSTNFVYLQAGPDPVHAAWIYDAPLVLTTPARGPAIGGELLTSTAHFELRQLPAPGLVGPVHVVGFLPPGRQFMRAAVKDWQRTDRSLRDEVLVHHGHGGLGPPPDGEVQTYGRDGSTITAVVVARAPTTFVIREGWHPRWRITVDGRPAPVRRVSPDFLAVDVPAGEHRIVARFERPLWTWLLWLLVPLAIAAGPLAGALAAARRRRRRDAALPPAAVISG